MQKGAETGSAPLLELWRLVAGWLGVCRVEVGDLNFLSEADLGEQPDSVVVDVDLVPGEAVTRADRMGVVVVVPAFAAGEDGDPPVVPGVIAGLKAALAPEVRGGVDEPRGVKTEGYAKEGCPENHADSSSEAMAGGGESGTEAELHEAGDGEGEPVVLREPDVNRVAGEVRSVAPEEGGL